MPKQRRMTDENKPVSFRPSAMTRWQLDDLIERLNENQSQIIIRAIERLWMLEVGEPKTKAND
jgi:hypothetical protein